MNMELMIRISVFLGILIFMGLWELAAPRRQLQTSKNSRWIVNLTMTVLNSILIRVLFASSPFAAAILSQEKVWGLLNNVNVGLLGHCLIAVILLDLTVYLQHVMFHAIPTLWRVHMVHHSDLDFDVTTGVRFHPIEIVLSTVIKLGAVVLIGASPTAVLIFEVLLNATSMFNHSNVRIPSSVDRLLRWIVVTPDMHRIHHSVIPRETNRNFGFNLPWWDRMLGTYLQSPSHSQETMTIGLEHFRDPSQLTLRGVLALPVLGKPGNYPIGREKLKRRKIVGS